MKVFVEQPRYCITAPATPGLLNMLLSSSNEIIVGCDLWRRGRRWKRRLTSLPFFQQLRVNGALLGRWNLKEVKTGEGENSYKKQNGERSERERVDFMRDPRSPHDSGRPREPVLWYTKTTWPALGCDIKRRPHQTWHVKDSKREWEGKIYEHM